MSCWILLISTPSSCQRCVDKEFLCYGGKNLIPKKGYWRLDERSPNFLKCPNKIACLGDGDPNYIENSIDFDDTKSLIGKCARGYKKEMSSICEDGFGRAEDFECSDCSNVW